MIITLIIIASAFVIIYFVFNYKPKQKESLRDLYTEGLDLMVDGHRQGAYENFKKIISKDTANVKAYIKLGQVIREGGNPANALKIHSSVSLRRGLTYYERVELLKNISLDYYNLKKVDQAIQQCHKILKINKKNDWALNKLIYFYQKEKDWFNAKKYLELKLKNSGKSDNRSLALYKIQEGRFFLSKADFEKSRKCFEDALVICSDVSIAYYFIGESYSQESDAVYVEAEQKSQINISSDLHKEYAGEMERAREILAKAIEKWISYAKLKPESSWMVIHFLKDALFALDRYNEIEVVLKEILDKDSDNVDVIAALADYYNHMGDSVSALKIIDSGLEKDDSSLLVRLIRLKLLFSDKDSRNTSIKNELDCLIKDLVKNIDYQVYKNTSTDKDALWLYSMSDNKEYSK
ncbi:MAG: hypothetical protein CMG00_03500 [Candidatus Marinimicrobia bacterium]|nr:hypothetical protein [Candidatus Neomarinimicrobiota bacterium]|tara:strand:+ start:399 stop:1622 length:1224 start_codon:yes stop_codon:yes gene_type:complete